MGAKVKRRQQKLKEVGGEGIFKTTLAAVMQMYCCSLVPNNLQAYQITRIQ